MNPVHTTQSSFRRILGLTFFCGTASEAIHLINKGGLLVVPAAPALKDLPFDREYGAALRSANLIITDSALLVLLWNLLQRDSIRRLSGLVYLRTLISGSELREPGTTFWIMAGTQSAERNVAWLRSQDLPVTPQDVYIAPLYAGDITDETLLSAIRVRRPDHIVVTIGGGKQERLGLYLKHHLEWPVSIHCIGAAIAFLSGDQVRIPLWADRLYLGWLFRCVSNPRRYGLRYWQACRLIPLLVRYRDRLPDMTFAK